MERELTEQEVKAIELLKSALDAWPDSLALNMDEGDYTVYVYARDKDCGCLVEREVASFRQPSAFLF